MVCRCCNKDGPCFDSGDCAPGYKCCVDDEGNGLCRIEPYNWSVSLPFTAYEGTDIQVNVSHLGGCDVEQYYFYIFPISGVGFDPAEPEDLQLPANPRYTEFGSGSFNITIKSDSLVETDEYFRVKIYKSVYNSASPFVGLLAESPICRIAGATWQVEPLFGNSVNEGSNKAFEVTTTNVPEGTEFEWSIAHVTTTNQDFTGSNGLPAVNTPGGYGVIDAGGNATIVIPVVYPDAFTEGSEVFKVSISSGGTGVATSVNVTINDTSPTPAGTLQCGTAAASGGIQFTQQYYSVSEGAGSIRVHYNVGSLADRFVFYAGGGNGELYDTGFLTGQGSFSFSKPFGVRTIRVESEGQDANTRWCYTLMCPNDNSTPPLCDPFA